MRVPLGCGAKRLRRRLGGADPVWDPVGADLVWGPGGVDPDCRSADPGPVDPEVVSKRLNGRY